MTRTMPDLRTPAGLHWLLLLTLALAGCASAPHSPALLAPLPPGSLGHSIQLRQQVTANFGKGKHGHKRMEVALNVSPDAVTIIGVSPLGPRLFTLDWNGESVVLRAPDQPLAQLDPRWILADLQLAYWPLPPLRAALPKGMQLTEHGTARMLWRGRHLLWFRSSDKPDAWHSEVVIYNARQDYRLTVRPLALNPKQPH